ncbi:MAG: DNA polymerase III subunit delta [Lactobacillales bacterium]|jgi:DNA polymerase-3 subunit delta|nr:DNA polymerase III subunit delta [Lactobacillales bacterium]
MNLDLAIQKIKQGYISLIYVVYGTEIYLKERIKESLKEALFPISEEESDLITFDGKRIPISKILEEANTLPFFGEKRLIFIEDAWFLTSEKVTGVEVNSEELMNYFHSPLPSTILVFLTQNKLDGKRKTVKLLKKEAALLDVNPLDERGIRMHLFKESKINNFQIDKEALNLLVLLNDKDGKTFDVSRALSNLSLLMLYKSKEKKITKQDVENLIPKNLEYNVFDLSKFWLSGRLEEALELLSEMLLQGEEIIAIHAILLSQIRLLLQIKLLLEEGYQQSEMIKILKINPYRVKLALEQSQKFSVSLLKELFDEMVEIDYDMKTGKMEKELLLQLFLLKTAEKF